MNIKGLVIGIVSMLMVGTVSADLIRIQVEAVNQTQNIIDLYFENLNFDGMCAGEFDMSYNPDFEVGHIEMINGASDYMMFYNDDDESIYIAFAGVHNIDAHERYMRFEFIVPDGYIFTFENDLSFDFVILNEEEGPYEMVFVYDSSGGFNLPGVASVPDEDPIEDTNNSWGKVKKLFER